ncbi:hypothetical protein BN940_01401 [Castellaniella defragrans 65Phen]|uniref:Uncharacterized protein n=1 Tax=Castellaniella defragrans (strain DSM 12143 / CCUG 39792 / 65Phen) TaxID=1437824 RepID=W8X0I5_CASD6|nr:hypothetical protein BN940_01401 [Castellaniella defragrans 65Phen]
MAYPNAGGPWRARCSASSSAWGRRPARHRRNRVRAGAGTGIRRRRTGAAGCGWESGRRVDEGWTRGGRGARPGPPLAC